MIIFLKNNLFNQEGYMFKNYCFISHVGNVRWENQDNYLTTSENFFILADGMGGLDDGSQASQIACHISTFQDLKYLLPKPESFFRHYFHHIHENILHYTREHQKIPNSVGTTVVSVYIQEEHFFVAWCGDSRLYHFNSKEQSLKQITKDHSYVQNLIDKKIITWEQGLCHPKKNCITQAVGIGHSSFFDFQEKKYGHNDYLLLCSDGLTNEILDKQIESILCQPLSLREKTEK